MILVHASAVFAQDSVGVKLELKASYKGVEDNFPKFAFTLTNNSMASVVIPRNFIVSANQYSAVNIWAEIIYTRLIKDTCVTGDDVAPVRTSICIFGNRFGSERMSLPPCQKIEIEEIVHDYLEPGVYKIRFFLKESRFQNIKLQGSTEWINFEWQGSSLNKPIMTFQAL